MSGEHDGAVTASAVLTGEQAGAVERLVADAGDVDGGHPVSEAALLALRDEAAGARHLLLHDAAGVLVGYAQLPSGAGGGGELLVAPGARRRGAGALLAAALEREAESAGASELRVWAHGGSAGAAALARRRGYRVVRELQHRSRPLGHDAPLTPVDLPDDVHLRPFEVGHDEQAWLALNAAAFADHPEQGRWTASDLAVRLAEPWFDPDGLLLALDAQTGRLLASHWTKVEVVGGRTVGEVYVVAVDPRSQGRGLGRTVVLAGLHHLDLRGAERAELYVEGGNAAALRLYDRLGFAVDAVDVQYARPAGGAAQG